MVSRLSRLLRRWWARLPRLYLAVGIRIRSGRTWWLPVPLFLVEDLTGTLAVAGGWLLRRHPRLRTSGLGLAAARVLPELPRIVRVFRAQPPMVLAEISGSPEGGRPGLRVLLL
ncbi:MAG TPA: hypothetical protein VF282_02045, partial [Bacillota bacterium]